MIAAEQKLQLDLSWALDAVEGDRDLLKEVVADVMTETPFQLKELEASCRAADGAQIARTAHTLKGSVGILGRGRAWELAGIIEQMGYSGQAEEACQALHRLIYELEQLKGFFAKPHWEQYV